MVTSLLIGLSDLPGRTLSPRGRMLLVRYALLATFVIVTGEKVITDWALGYLAIDLRIYRAAAQVALGGGNPWTAGVDGYVFAGTPPSLLPYLPAALLPETLAIAVYAACFMGAALFTVRRLGLPLWWLLFPPLAQGVLVLNSDVLVATFLVAGPGWGAGAVISKSYAAVPLIIRRDWRPLAIAAVVSMALAPWWLEWLAQREHVTQTLASQSLGGLSSWGTWLMIPTIAALLVLRRRGAEWLVVPSLWPYTQLHYSTIALPALGRAPLLAFLMSFGIPLLPPLAVVLEATRMLVIGRLSARAASAQQLPAKLDGDTHRDETDTANIRSTRIGTGSESDLP